MRALREGPGRSLEVIDQTKLPFALEWATLRTAEETAAAIKTMVVRGAPLIGVAGAYGLALGAGALERSYALLKSTRPTAVNLAWALDRVRKAVEPLPAAQRADRAWAEAGAIAAAESDACKRIGEAGLPLFKDAKNVLTHCNAGWLATGDWGTALAPLYAARQAGVALHVWVDETRPRNQGTLTAWELNDGGVPHTLIADNAGGLLMQRGQVDACIVGADRIAANGDVCNKVGTYLKALAAHDNQVPFYVAAPVSTIDIALPAGADIPIEERSGDELRVWNGVQLMPPQTKVANPAFDVTPAKYVTAIITERGVVPATREGIARLFNMIKDALALVKAAKHCASAGLIPGTSGNLSMRTTAGLLITPSGVPYSDLGTEDLVELEMDGTPLRAFAPVPSSEWRLHVQIYESRPETQAIVHTHSRYATTLSCLRRAIPAVHYYIAVAGTSTVRCADYATYGTVELGQNALRALDGSKACLLANHGLVALGHSLADAVKVAFEIENVAALYWHALQAGQPVLLDDAEIQRVAEKLKGYGQR